MLLIDEIDRSDHEFEAFLLEFLSDFQISIPERGAIRAYERPVVILTSNRTRELHEALRRRCVYHWIDYPTPEREMRIMMMRASGVGERAARAVVAAVGRLRREPLGQAAPALRKRSNGPRRRRCSTSRVPVGPKRSNARSASCSRTRTISSMSRRRSTPSSRRRRRERHCTRRSLTSSASPRLLRRAGFAVAPEQTMAWLAAIELLGPEQIGDIRRAAHATLAPPPERFADFDALFDAHFLGALSPGTGSGAE